MLHDAKTTETVLDHDALEHEARELLEKIYDMVERPYTRDLIREYGLLNYRRGVVSRVK